MSFASLILKVNVLSLSSCTGMFFSFVVVLTIFAFVWTFWTTKLLFKSIVHFPLLLWKSISLTFNNILFTLCYYIFSKSLTFLHACHTDSNSSLCRPWFCLSFIDNCASNWRIRYFMNYRKHLWLWCWLNAMSSLIGKWSLNFTQQVECCNSQNKFCTLYFLQYFWYSNLYHTHWSYRVTFLKSSSLTIRGYNLHRLP